MLSQAGFLANTNLGVYNRERKKGGRKGVILIGEGVGEEEALEVKIYMSLSCCSWCE